MKKTLLLLAASTALTAAIGVPAWSAMRAPILENTRHAAEETRSPVHRVSDREDDDDRRKGWWSGRRGDDDDEYERDDDDDDDDEGGYRAQMNPAPAGTVAPPKNGLFGNGARPKVQVN